MIPRGSVFAKLVATMLTMAVSLLVIVTAFFLVVLGPSLNRLVFRLTDEYTRAVVATAPDFESAKRLATRVDVQVRYESASRRTGWATDTTVPTIAQVRGTEGGLVDNHLLTRRRLTVMPAPDGGTYLFAWNFHGSFQRAHNVLLAVLLAAILGIVLTTHLVLSRLLRPLRVLSDGVARVGGGGGGDLDVVLPVQTHDEFGRLTTAFNDMVARVRAMVRARDQLLADVSHELRSPITRLKVALELAPQDEQRARLAADVAEMERKVAELLELERLRSGRGSGGLEMTRLDLVAVVRDVAAAYRDRQPGVVLSAPATAIPVHADVEKIRTVLRNLMENAVKYSLPESRPVELSVLAEAGTAVMRVRDDGIGIPPADGERVFEPFYRVDASRATATGGYGLGLSICKRVMEAHGGTIVLESPTGHGASFLLTLPLAASPPRSGL